MVVREIAPSIYSVGALDFDRRLFDSLIPLPQGTSYNSYLVKGTKKTALIDTVDPTTEIDLVTNLVKAKVDTIDYLVVNHAEQDHSGSLPMIAELFPQAKVVTNEKCVDMVTHLLDIGSERCVVIKDRETLDLGGKTLEFLITPWVHWPETMLTYAREDRVLFSCDLFGSHMAESTLLVNDWKMVYQSAKRYYAEIMMPFRKSITKYIESVEQMDISIIAPSHGPLQNNPEWILERYKDWTSDNTRNKVLIPYVSMHGSTKRMVLMLTELLMERDIGVKPFNLTGADTGLLAMELVDAATVILATPTVLFGPHPTMVSAAYLANLVKPKTRYASVIGSYGWGGKTIDVITSMIPHIKAEIIPPVYITGVPDEKTREELKKMAYTIAQKHSSDPLVIK